MAGQKLESPKQAEEFGSLGLNFCGAIFGGALRGVFCGAEPRKLYPREKPRRRNRHSDRAVDRELDMERRYSTVASKAVEILPNEVNAGR